MKSAVRWIPIAVLSLLLCWGCQPQPGALVQNVPPPPVARNHLAPLPQLPQTHKTEYTPPKREEPQVEEPSRPQAPEAAWVAAAPGRWTHIILHHSADDVGDATVFDRIHRARGWDELGYHFVICNSRKDGVVEVGPRWTKQKHGAHCRVDPSDSNYWNEHGIGICLVGDLGKHPPSEKQLASAARLMAWLMTQSNIPEKNVLGHGQVPGAKTACPGKYFPYAELMRRIRVLRAK
ncbi:MAG: N-acetylmuramoyl-L-alanine amidase [Planctomycetes bacterium]|nr:N-acetylmuramoyl-L-alanine amidase [Planctomycetota bacterium]